MVIYHEYICFVCWHNMYSTRHSMHEYIIHVSWNNWRLCMQGLISRIWKLHWQECGHLWTSMKPQGHQVPSHGLSSSTIAGDVCKLYIVLWILGQLHGAGSYSNWSEPAVVADWTARVRTARVRTAWAFKCDVWYHRRIRVSDHGENTKVLLVI